MAVVPRICLLLSSDEQEAQAQIICEILINRFGVKNVVLRSAWVPADRLLLLTQTTSEVPNLPPALLFVLLGSATPSTTVLETDSPAPLLSLNDHSSETDPLETAFSIAKFCSLSSADLRLAVYKTMQQIRQARLVQDAQLATRSIQYSLAISDCYESKSTITGDAVQLDGRVRGKVRDRYDLGTNKIALVTTDRQSGFDRQLAQVPFKGAVLNLTSAFWFDQTRKIINNHLLSTPHPYVSIARKCEPFPIEFVMRSYMTGSTSTSIWKNYQDGIRTYCGHQLPEGMIKNQKLAHNLLTPTTKEEEHDRPISCAEIVTENWMTQADLDVCANAAKSIFALGQEIADQHGLILVDTKYEFGKDVETGEILLIDEVHTPDSSRYWLASTYEERMAQDMEPDNIDKEFLRLWFRDNCDPYNDAVLPEAPRELVMELSRRYILLYEMITSKPFDFESVMGLRGEEAIAEAIKSNL